MTLAEWAASLEPTDADRALADAALQDTEAVAHAARDHPLLAKAAALEPVARHAVAAHVLDYDDLHLPSTTHVSAVCIPAALGSPDAYLAGAGVMARVGMALGWAHYARGWHATCTAGAFGAATAAAVTRGLDADRIAVALALAVPAAGGVQRAFGSDAKSLQVGFAVAAGVRAAELAEAGATADPGAFDDWLGLMGAGEIGLDGPAVPGGLAVKQWPCCYALQRPIAAARRLAGDPGGRIAVRTPASSVQPLVHDRPRTGLEGKFSLKYALAATLLDGEPGFDSFSDAGVARPEAHALMDRIDVELEPGGDGLLAGAFVIGDVSLTDVPPPDLDAKRALCGGVAGPSSWADRRSG